MNQNNDMDLETMTSRAASQLANFCYYHNENGHPDDYMDRRVVHARVVDARRQAAVL